MAPAAFKQFALPYLTQIAEKLPGKLKEMGLERVPMTVFAKGAWYALEDLCKTDYNVLEAKAPRGDIVGVHPLRALSPGDKRIGVFLGNALVQVLESL